MWACQIRGWRGKGLGFLSSPETYKYRHDAAFMLVWTYNTNQIIHIALRSVLAGRAISTLDDPIIFIKFSRILVDPLLYQIKNCCIICYP